MRKMIVLFMIALASLWASLVVLGQEKRPTEAKQPPPQVFEGRLRIKVTGIEKVQIWKPLPNNPYSPTYAAKEGMDLLVVKFEVKKIQTQEPEWDQSFKGFELEDQSGKKYSSVILETNSREIGFGVPQGISLKVFRMSGLSFDIEGLESSSASSAPISRVMPGDPNSTSRDGKGSGNGYTALLHDADSLEDIAFSPDGKLLVSGWGTHQATATIWDVASGKVLQNVIPDTTGFVESVAFSPDGRTLATGTGTGILKLWDVETGRLVRPVAVSSMVLDLAFSPDGATLAATQVSLAATRSWDCVGLWEVATGRLVRVFTGHTSYVDSVAFSSDGKTLASGSSDNSVRLWNVATGAQVRTLTGHGNRVTSVAFSPNGKIVASSSEDQTVRLWDVATGMEVRTLYGSMQTPSGHKGRVKCLAFSPDGTLIATAGEDRAVKLWDVSKGLVLRSLNEFSYGVRRVAFSPDGKTLATAGGNEVRLWNVQALLANPLSAAPR